MSQPSPSTPEPDRNGSGPRSGPDGAPVRGAAWRRFLPLLALAAGLLVFLALGGHRYVALDILEEHREALLALVADHAVLAPLVFIGAYAVMAAFSIPGAAIMTVAGGFLFGILGGAACSVVGATLGAIALFLAARTALGGLLRDRAGAAVNRMSAGFRENALSYLLVLRLIPLFPFWLVNLVPALVGVPLKVFALGTFVGIIPGSLVYAAVGNGLGAFFEAGETADIESALYQPEVLLPIVALVVLSLAPVVYKKVKSRRNGATRR
ncbi:TVP38/TMEM64 family protein [Pelagibius sp. CAU 1746]|uniref:TVP38/TMEM64 family protein n=1 Tax=Pelagibius sp. CAU 1746 TaxID=3140370 RepID=UPI00325A85DC